MLVEVRGGWINLDDVAFVREMKVPIEVEGQGTTYEVHSKITLRNGDVEEMWTRPDEFIAPSYQVVAASPGFYRLEPNGVFHSPPDPFLDCVKTPIVAWRIGPAGDAQPITPGDFNRPDDMPAVLCPGGMVIEPFVRHFQTIYAWLESHVALRAK